MDGFDLGWVVGLFEGEGTLVKIDGQGRRNQRIMALGMTDEDSVRRFAEIVNCGKVIGPIRYTRDESHKPMWRWVLYRWSEIKHLIELMQPHMGARRAEKMQDLLDNPPSRVRGTDDHCPHGHEWTAENTYINRQGSRNCRACARARHHRRRQRLAMTGPSAQSSSGA